MSEINLSTQNIIQQRFRTGGLEVFPSQNRICLGSNEQVLQPKVMQLLQILCSAKGETLSKEMLTQLLWPDVQVGTDSLANTMARLRRALKEQSKHPQFIETVQRKGYRWLPPVHSEPKKTGDYKLRIVVLFTTLVVAGLIAFYMIIQPEQKKFPFKDLSIETTDKGLEVAVGVEGELDDAKITKVKEEVGRIVGEDYSHMEVVIDELKEGCKTSAEKSTILENGDSGDNRENTKRKSSTGENQITHCDDE